MTLQEAIQQGLRLAVAVMPDHERLAAELYITPDGVVFLDTFWSQPDPSSFRAHFMAGTATVGPPWMVGDWVIREVDEETDPEYVTEWARWQQAKRATDGTRERGAPGEFATARSVRAVFPLRALRGQFVRSAIRNRPEPHLAPTEC